MAVCVCGEEMAYNGSRGEGAGLLCAPPPLPPTYRERKGEGVKEDQDIALCVRVPCFRGDVKNGHIHGEGAVVGGWAAKRPPSWGEGRRWKTPAASARLNKNSYFRFILLSAGVPASQSSGTNPEKRGGGGGEGEAPTYSPCSAVEGELPPPPNTHKQLLPPKKRRAVLRGERALLPPGNPRPLLSLNALLPRGREEAGGGGNNPSPPTPSLHTVVVVLPPLSRPYGERRGGVQ